jgi:phosphoglycolate phosphatase
MTSPPVNDPEALHRILARTEVLLLDFDGPVCDVFAGLPASVVVDQLCVVLADGGYGDPPPEIEKSSDPFDVLKYAATLGETEARYVNAAFTAHEVEAIATAEPTPGAHELIRAWSQGSRSLAIVSNNSTLAVEAYLDLHGVEFYVAHVSARSSADPALLKPSPHLLNEAMTTLGVAAEHVAFVGDSVTDVEAAHAAGIVLIGYANKLNKAERLSAAGSDLIITDILDLLRAVLTD